MRVRVHVRFRCHYLRAWGRKNKTCVAACHGDALDDFNCVFDYVPLDLFIFILVQLDDGVSVGLQHFPGCICIADVTGIIAIWGTVALTLWQLQLLWP